ncbi:MAG: hypothetical protein K6G40_09410 [Eubacterium sp.]|nr:hypothetical protein [Eubacterium sp.]
MIRTVNGEIYNIDAKVSQDFLLDAKAFYEGNEHDYDLLCITNLYDEPIYAGKTDFLNNTLDNDCKINFSSDMFRKAKDNSHIKNGGIIPALNDKNEPVCLLVSSPDVYIHDYENTNADFDFRPLELYDCIALFEVTENAYILLTKILPNYSGRVICYGEEWESLKEIIPAFDNLYFAATEPEFAALTKGKKLMCLSHFYSALAGYKKRAEEGIFSYDEIITLICFFSIRKSYGKDNPEKNFFIVNPLFPKEGLMAICDKTAAVYSYAKSNGFIPIVTITNSDDHMYSDYPGDDIWGKFFKQPSGENADEVQTSLNVYEMPKGQISFACRYLMSQITEIKSESFFSTAYYNDRINTEVENTKKSLGIDPAKTLGVLIRGTDYTMTKLPGHSKMATPEQVYEKIIEFSKTEDYDKIYLATEDEKILDKMKDLCKDKLIYLDQIRYNVNAGEYLADCKKGIENEGYIRGKDYLVTLKILTECRSFIASGHCNGTSFVLNEGSFNKCFVFDLGCY